jgi:signal peptidase I
LNRSVYYIHAPQRGDIVVLRDPADHGLSVKRVIAAAGDCVVLKEGRVYVNGRRLDEPYLTPGVLTFPQTKAREQRLDCGEGQYVVFGDNRGNSADSRCYGPVSRGGILGRVVR